MAPIFTSFSLSVVNDQCFTLWGSASLRRKLPKVERELTRIRSEIEQLDGRLRYLGHRIAFSTINCTLVEEARALSPTPPESYSIASVFTDASRSLIEFLRGVMAIAVWVGVWGVVWLPVLGVAYLVYRRTRRAVQH